MAINDNATARNFTIGRNGVGVAPNEGTDTRTIQAYLGHKDIRHTVRYTELSPVRFKGLWRD